MTPDTSAGAAAYTRLALRGYDLWVLGLSNRFAWGCPTAAVQLPFFRRHVGRRHLDVGVGTGYFLARAGLGPGHEVALLDLNPNCLAVARARIAPIVPALYRRDVMRPLALPEGTAFDSISLFCVLHCLPGGMAGKGTAVANLRPYLAADGVPFGSTVLGDDAGHNGFGRRLMRLYNRRGFFANAGDTLPALDAMLRRHFQAVDIRRHGRVALFEARRPLG